MTKLVLNEAQVNVVKAALNGKQTTTAVVTNTHVGENTVTFENRTSIVIKSMGVESGSTVTIDADLNFIVSKKPKVEPSRTSGSIRNQAAANKIIADVKAR